jgi:O-antigen/teichoic acid export membrane protein
VTLLGSEFRGSIHDLRVLAPGGFGMLALKLLANTLTAQRKPMLANAAIGVAFLATVALDLLLIPDHGALGAAVASTLSYTAGGVAVMIIFARSLGVGIRELVPRRADVLALGGVLSRGSASRQAESEATQAAGSETLETQPTVSPPQPAS